MREPISLGIGMTQSIALGAEQYVSDMWSVSVSSFKQKALFGTLIAALRPGFTDAQTRSILNRSAMGSVEMPDIHGHPDFSVYIL
jgi:hypothetical protein